ncbi:MAG: GH3 auxin-responsive promoter family protein, partial [Ginsengibacter sp.]
MALIDIKLPESLSRVLNIPVSSPRRQQLKVLIKLLKKSRFTEFGQKYLFDEILLNKHPGKAFQQIVPAYNYSKIFHEWWHRALDGKPDICWPGIIKFFALS